MPILIADPLAYFNQRDREQARQLEQLPVCYRCDNPIQQEWAVCIDGYWFCDDCIEFYRKEIEVE